MMDNSIEIQTFKVVIIGDSFTGKTSLTYRLCTGKFYEKLETTIGVDFFEKIVKINDERVKLQLWDSAGQERFRKSMTIHYYRNVDAIVFVYDVTSLSSFESLWMWAEEYKHYTVPERIVKILIGNKCDLKKLKKVDTSDAQRFANRFSMPLWEVSTKNDNDKEIIETIFSTLAEKLLKDKPATNLMKSPVLRGSTLRPKPIQEETVKLKHEKAKLEKETKTCCNVK